MKCVNFDHIFSNDIERRYNKYPAMLAEDDRKKKSNQQMSKGSGAKTRTTNNSTARTKGVSQQPVASSSKTATSRSNSQKLHSSRLTRDQSAPTPHQETSSRPRRNRSVWDQQKGSHVRLRNVDVDTSNDDTGHPPSPSESLASFFVPSDEE